MALGFKGSRRDRDTELVAEPGAHITCESVSRSLKRHLEGPTIVMVAAVLVT